MAFKQIHCRVDDEILKTSAKLKSSAFKNEELTFFRLYTGSKSSWHSYVYQMGVVAIKKEWEKLGIRLSEEK